MIRLTCFRKPIRDKRFIKIIMPILENKEILKMKDFIQHGKTSTLEHCVNVAYISYKICRLFKLDYKSMTRAALMHDMYLYDWHDDIPEEIDKLGKHAFYHPKVALSNAIRNFKLNKKERDIIMRHMWPVTIIPPKTSEGWIIVIVDKYCAIYEFFLDLNKKYFRH